MRKKDGVVGSVDGRLARWGTGTKSKSASASRGSRAGPEASPGCDRRRKQRRRLAGSGRWKGGARRRAAGTDGRRTIRRWTRCSNDGAPGVPSCTVDGSRTASPSTAATSATPCSTAGWCQQRPHACTFWRQATDAAPGQPPDRAQQARFYACFSSRAASSGGANRGGASSWNACAWTWPHWAKCFADDARWCKTATAFTHDTATSASPFAGPRADDG